MNKYFKFLLILIVCFLIIPRVAFAAWWNPFTWGIFHKTPKISTVEIRGNQLPVNVATSTTKQKIDPLQKVPNDTKASSTINRQTYQDVINQSLGIFLTQNPKYKKENDPNGLLWNKFEKIIQSGKYDIYAKTPEQLIAIFKKVDRDVAASLAAVSENTPITIDTLQTTADVSSEDISRLRWYCTIGEGKNVCNKESFFEAYYSNAGLRVVINDLAKKQQAQATKDQLDAQWLEYKMTHVSTGSGHTPSYPAANYQASIPQKTDTQKINSDTPVVILGRGTFYTDSLGITHYTGPNGYSGTASVDSLGSVHYSDNYGNSGNCITNTIGTNCYGNGGSQTSSYTDSLGATHYNGSAGFSGSSYTDSLGEIHYTDNAGNSLSCTKDSLGGTHCN
ncbi:MAG: hypothetical protein PHO56_01085 [Patescibacteria group bacterium]|nr:hypothetical protein [Patescibacteria group bacterium]